MKKPVLLLLGTMLTAMAWGQAARLVINNAGATDPYLVWNPDPDAADNAGAYLVIDNPATNAITYNGGVNAQGNFRTEAAQNKIRWAVGTAAAGSSYVINYGNQANVGFPLTVNILTPGVGAGSFVFSTYSYYPFVNTSGYGGALAAANSWDNFQYRLPSGVTHMNDYATGSVNNSQNAVDRFWMIDTKEAGFAYATSPSVEITFDHAHGDIQAGNAIVPGVTALMAQRFNNTVNQWGDVLFPASVFTPNVAPGVSRVLSGPVSAANLFKSWTLSNFNQPLPVELVEFKGSCINGLVRLEWTTASELNNDYFLVERSMDLSQWEVIGQVDGSGNSVAPINYSFVDETSGGTAYYRLRQVDLDGTENPHPMISAGCEGVNGTEIVSTWDDGANVNVMVSSTNEVIHDVVLVDLQGRVMGTKPKQTFVNGMTTISFPKESLSTGVYVFQLHNSTNVMQRRVMVY